MKRICIIIVAVLLSFRVQAQFTEIPTGTTADIYEMALHGDTLIVLGYPDYFAKYCITTEDWTVLSSPGFSNYDNTNFQVVDNNYYVLSAQGFPYDHNYVLKSSDNGNSWDTLFHTPGLFYTMSIMDSTFGLIGGSFGSYAIADGSETSWALQDSLYGTITTSAFYGDSTVIMESTGQSFVSQDRGATWYSAGGSPNTPEYTMFLNQDTIFSISKEGNGDVTSYFSVSKNGGYSWNYGDACNLDWSYYNCYSDVYDLHMGTNGKGYILAHVEYTHYFWQGYWNNEITNKMSIFYTDNYGDSWTSYVTDITEIMYDMVFLNDTTAFIGGKNGLLLKWDLTVPLSDVLGTDLEDNITKLNVYPNPATDIIHISNDAINPVNFEIYSTVGQLIKAGIIENSQIDISDIAAGQYVLMTSTDQSIYTTQFVKK